MKSLAIVNAGVLKSLERAIIGIGSATLAISVFMLGSAAFNYFRYNDTEAKLAATKQQIHTLSETVSKSRRLKFQPPTEKEVTIVQAALDRFSVVYDCHLTEVTSTNDEGPYMTRYSKNGSEAGWKQTTIQFQVVGSLNNLLSLLRELTSISIPVELQAVEITPLDSLRYGHPQVSAKVGIQVMKQEAAR